MVLARDAIAQGLLVLESMGVRTVHWTQADVVKDATPQKHTYVCSEERTLVHCPVLIRTEARAP